MKKRKAEKHYDQTAKELKPLIEGQTVRMKPFALGDRVWKKGQITKRLDERSYEVLARDGNLLRRNRVHLKPTQEQSLTQHHNELTKQSIEQQTNVTPMNLQDRKESPVKPETPRIARGTQKKEETLRKTLDMAIAEEPEPITPRKIATQPEHDVRRSRSGRILRQPSHLKNYVK